MAIVVKPTTILNFHQALVKLGEGQTKASATLAAALLTVSLSMGKGTTNHEGKLEEMDTRLDVMESKLDIIISKLCQTN